MATTDPTGARERIAGSLDRVTQLARIVVAGFAVTVGLLLLVLAGIYRVTSETNRAVNNRIEALETDVADLEDVNEQAVDEVVRLATLLQENGIDPGLIEIRPREDDGDG